MPGGVGGPCGGPWDLSRGHTPSHRNSGLHSYGTGLQYHTGLIITYVYMCVYVCMSMYIYMYRCYSI